MIGVLLRPQVWGSIAGVVLLISLVSAIYLKGRSDGGASIRAAAAKEALQRIHQMEKSNANFNRMSDRDRCLVFMRDSGLPADHCD